MEEGYMYIKGPANQHYYQKTKTERSLFSMKKIVITIIMFAIAIGLIIGVILPIANHGKSTGQTAKTRMTTIDGDVSTLMQPIN